MRASPIPCVPVAVFFGLAREKMWLQVEEFLLMPVEEALKTIKTDLARWKPNCALVMIDFALRHGFLDPDHPVRNAADGLRWTCP